MRRGRSILVGRLFAGIAPGQFSLSIVKRLDVFARLRSAPWAGLTLRVRGVHLSLSTSHGYIGDRDLANVVWLYGRQS